MQDLLDENANTCEDAVALRQQFFQDHKNREFAKWKSQAIEARDKMNIAPNQRGWVDRHGLQGVPSTERCKETLMLAFFAMQDEARRRGVTANSMQQDWCCDPGCSVYRKPWGTVHEVIGQRALPYVFNNERVMMTQDTLLNVQLIT